MAGENGYRMHLTLEEHFLNLKNCYPEIEQLYNLWGLLKKHIADELNNSRCVFVSYSFHDGSHSRTIIQMIERFLGEERIRDLSATDTFMILVCAYAHDYGMAQTIERIYGILGSDEFEAFLKNMREEKKSLEDEDSKAINNLLNYMNDKGEKIELRDLYYSIVIVIQTYLRPLHWKGVVDIESDLKGLFQGNLRERFISGGEGITNICMCHGQDINSIFKMSPSACGIVGDDFHPRLVAAMLRLGDLLDLDNERFPMWFVREIQREENCIPKLSQLNYYKHEAISHFLVKPDKIEITADCRHGDDKNRVARLVSNWTTMLEDECKMLVQNWGKIAPANFGLPPGNLDIQIFVDGREYLSENKNLKMKMSQEKVMDLLEGSHIYKDKYVGIREMLQNAVDASLIQLWKDIWQNKYQAYGLKKDDANSEMDILDFLKDNRTNIFANYDINVEVIKDILNNKVYVVIKDKGIGISLEDIQYISEIGSNKKKNKKIQEILDKMPAWLKPSGYFGIGLQSVFQLTDRIDFYTRQPNEPERLISLYSYGADKGRIEMSEVPENVDGLYFDNSVPGTNVKITIEPKKVMDEQLSYYDVDFDTDEQNEVVFGEIAQACTNILKGMSRDYFNISLQTMTCRGEFDPCPEKEPPISMRRSYFYINSDKAYKGPGFGKELRTLWHKDECNKNQQYEFIDNKTYLWHKESKCFYTWSLRPCIIKEKVDNGRSIKQVFLPETVQGLYNVSYKFNKISNVDAIYSRNNRTKHFHAGFLNLDILVLDDKPDKYLNIDRERLKEEAIDEEELLNIRKVMLQKWCEYFCSGDYSGTRFESKPGDLLSLVLLFYQNVTHDSFETFKMRYEKEIASATKNVVLGKEQIPVHLLWKEGQVFQTEVDMKSNLSDDNPLKRHYEDATFKSSGLLKKATRSLVLEITKNLPKLQTKDDERAKYKNDEHQLLDDEMIVEKKIQMDDSVVEHLPHRLINIKSIKRGSANTLIYEFTINKKSEYARLIDMDDTAKRLDYLGVFRTLKDPNERHYVNMIKTVFKPNSKFCNLVLPKYPHTFHQGLNFESSMDRCIRDYILSPFDEGAVEILRRSVKSGIKELSAFKHYMMNDSRQMEKCVNYVLKCRFPENQEKKVQIEKEYEEFIKDFYEIVFEHRLKAKK